MLLLLLLLGTRLLTSTAGWSTAAANPLTFPSLLISRTRVTSLPRLPPGRLGSLARVVAYLATLKVGDVGGEDCGDEVNDFPVHFNDFHARPSTIVFVFTAAGPGRNFPSEER